jgi:hypothetical protein
LESQCPLTFNPRHQVTCEEIRTVLFSGNQRVRDDFNGHFSPGIDNFIILMAKAYARIGEIEAKVPHDDRSAWTWRFLLGAFNNLLTSFHLLISGFLVPAGNLMRHYGEASAMALLCSHRRINTFDVMMKNPDNFPYHKALDLVERKQNTKCLEIDPEGWRTFKEITEFYSNLSHASMFSLGATHVFAEGGVQIGSEFDSAKLREYQKEIGLALSAAMRLYETVLAAEKHLMESTPA